MTRHGKFKSNVVNVFGWILLRVLFVIFAVVAAGVFLLKLIRPTRVRNVFCVVYVRFFRVALL